MRVLAIVSRFKWSHIDYMAALGNEVDLFVGWSDVGHQGAPEHAIREGIRAQDIGSLASDGQPVVARNLARLINESRPDLVHILYYNHEQLTIMLRDMLDGGTPLIWECRDPLTLENSRPGSSAWQLEARAIRAADGHILVSNALRRYLEWAHDVDLGRALIVPHAFAARNAGPLSPKLSSIDGRTHIALVGTADELPNHGRYYVDIIRRLVRMGFVVHSHFHEIDGVSLQPYMQLAEDLPDYHFHPTVSFRQEWLLSALTSRYDLMGVFHELDAPLHNESQTLEVCMPTKAVSGWLHGAIPVVTFPHYAGLAERIEELGIGFVVDDWDGLRALLGDREAIARATTACLAHREEFTHEYQVRRIASFYRDTVSESTPVPVAAEGVAT